MPAEVPWQSIVPILRLGQGFDRMRRFMWRPGRIFLVLSFFLLIGGGCASVEAGDPSDAELAYRYYLQGRAAFRGERLSLALENFNAALSYKPKDPDTLSMVGQVHYLREAYGKAISSFEQALASPELSAPGDVQGWLVCCYYA